MRLNIVILLMCSALLASCNSDAVFSSNTSFSDGWALQDSVKVDLPEMDSLSAYNLFINVRNSNDYPFNNLFLIVSMEYPQGKTETDTLEYRMANADGTWMGTGIGSVKENKLWYKENVRFFEEGNYVIKIGHAVRNNGEVEGVSQLEGIADVGYSIEAANNN